MHDMTHTNTRTQTHTSIIPFSFVLFNARQIIHIFVRWKRIARVFSLDTMAHTATTRMFVNVRECACVCVFVSLLECKQWYILCKISFIILPLCIKFSTSRLDCICSRLILRTICLSTHVIRLSRLPRPPHLSRIRHSEAGYTDTHSVLMFLV